MKEPTLRVRDIYWNYPDANMPCLFLQGCMRAHNGNPCPNCWNPDLWNPNEGIEIGISEILNEIIKWADEDSILISGGEPLDQAESLWHLVDALTKQLNYKVYIYTGYSIFEVIKDINKAAVAVIANGMIYGLYDPNCKSYKTYNGIPVGSSNQIFLVKEDLNEIYKPYLDKTLNRLIEEN